jgi:hypothetical protein
MNDSSNKKYGKFALMILASMALMYGVMYLNSYEASHVRWSEMRLYMTLAMGGTMGALMWAFMRGMYDDTRKNVVVLAASALLFAGGLWLARSQATVQDSSWMRAMIPHHSIAILTSERAQIEDVRVRKLADEIIAAQRREIDEMEWLLEDIEQNGPALTQEEASARQVPDFSREEPLSASLR